jgi:hypothetical protein
MSPHYEIFARRANGEARFWGRDDIFIYSWRRENRQR